MEYQIIKCSEEDRPWLFDLHKKTMNEYVDKVYNWNPKREKEYFDDKTKMARYHLIVHEKHLMLRTVDRLYPNNRT